ncbi:MAG: hypothetical protein O2818_04715 [Bacteroidetes bacterium]|nr:hypothetical protein [Bacteroidota bacterium]
MNKKALYYTLIVLGALDLLLWVINGFEFGWLELVVGVNVISENAAWIMMGVGFWLLKKEKAKEKSEIDDVADLDEGEQIIYKNSGNSTIITLTTKKIIYRAFGVEEETVKNHENVVADEKAFFNYGDIESVKTVKIKDVAKTKIGKLYGLTFGISLTMKNGSVMNLPTTKSELICAHITKHLRA